MIHRVVRMTFHSDQVEPFRALFAQVHHAIEAQPGCLGVRLWSDTRWPHILSTFSQWESEADLDAYRNSEFFRSTWAQTRPLFAAPPVATSYADVTPEL